MNIKGLNQMEARNEQAPKEGRHTMISHEEKKRLETARRSNIPWQKWGHI